MRDKIAGAIYGMALGDAMGMPSELWGREKVRKYFGKIEGLLDGPKENSVACNYKKGQFTDDTGQALVIIDSLKDTKFKPNSKDIATKLLKWAQKEKAFENNILGRLFNAHDKEKLADFVYSVSEVTHTSDITIAGAAMIAVAVSSAIENNDFDIVIKDVFEIEPIARRLGAETYSPSLTERIKIGIYLANKYKDNENLFLEKLYDIVGAGVNISESVPSAISIAYYAQDPNKCALLCANLAGDTDTIGAMATAICGAFKGIDYIKEEYIESLNKANDVDFNSYISILMNGRSCL